MLLNKLHRLLLIKNLSTLVLLVFIVINLLFTGGEIMLSRHSCIDDLVDFNKNKLLIIEQIYIP